MEIPWVGAVKLYASGTSNQVTPNSWSNLAILVAMVIATPVIIEMITDRINSTKNTSEEEE
jgi:hypothetical protein